MKYQVGDVFSDFIIRRAETVEELRAEAYVLEHQPTKAKLLYIATDDDNKVFSVSFRTPPTDSTGVAHIIEHSVLCGSDKYPLKEPFVELVKGSLNTFLNAMTYPDKTMYPVASRNMQDFYHLMDVYLDAVFFPNIRHDAQILMQEGWHYEADEATGTLQYNGVVYNEMKGALSSPDEILQERVMETLFPDTTYGVESGGDPDHIPDLTYDQFKAFYERHYHPSNAYFFLYGDMQLAAALAKIQTGYLDQYTMRKPQSDIATQLPLAAPAVNEFPYGIGVDEDTKEKTLHQIAIVFPEDFAPADALAVEVLNYALLTMPGAVVKKKLMDAGVGADVSGAFVESMKQPLWQIEVVGSERAHKDTLLRVWNESIHELIADGIPSDILEAALNRIEFSLREADFQGRPKGLFYNIRALNYWLYDRDPLYGLRYEQDLQTLRRHIGSDYFVRLLQRYVVDNLHQTATSLYPVAGLTQEKEAQDEAVMADVRASMTEGEWQQVIADTAALKQRQQTPDSEEALATIPLLTRDDLPREIETDEMEQAHIEDATVYHYVGDSRGIMYANLYFPLDHLDVQDYPYVFLLTDILGHMDTVNYTYGELARQVDMHTGGIGIHVASYSQYDDDRTYRPFMVVQGKALTNQAGILMKLMGETIRRTVFTDTRRLQELVQERRADWEMELFRRGHTLMKNRVLSYISPVERFRDEGALTYYEFLRRADQLGWGTVAQRLAQVAERIVTTPHLVAQSVGGEEERTAFLRHLSEAWQPQVMSAAAASQKLTLQQGNEAFLSAGKVQYVAQGGNYRRHGYQYTGAMVVLEQVLRYEYLWQQLRVLGGAYGAFVQMQTNGNLVLCSYRDPHLMNTLSVYRNLPEAIASFAVSDRVMTQYVIGAMAGTQTQLTLRMKADRAMARLFSQIPTQFRQQIRDQIIDCRQQDIRDLAPLFTDTLATAGVAVMGGESKIRAHEELFRTIHSYGR